MSPALVPLRTGYRLEPLLALAIFLFVFLHGPSCVLAAGRGSSGSGCSSSSSSSSKSCTAFANQSPLSRFCDHYHVDRRSKIGRRSQFSHLVSATGGVDGGDEAVERNDLRNDAVEYLECVAPDEDQLARDRLKRQLLQLGASYDRGFGASQSAREKANGVITSLEGYNLEQAAARGIGQDGGDGRREPGTVDDEVQSPLTGPWRMVWTSAIDVLTLQASPLFSVSAIYQVFEPPVITNIIDFIPRSQSLIPPTILPKSDSLVRARVTTRGSRREGLPNRVGLVFERVQVQPVQLLGMNIDVFPPLGFDLPRLPAEGLFGTSSPDSPGFFDVSYLDEEMLIIRQNEPGGLFVLVKVDSIDH